MRHFFFAAYIVNTKLRAWVIILSFLWCNSLFSQNIKAGVYMVNTLAQLLDASQRATAGNVIYIQDTCRICIPGKTIITLNAGVTLKSGRGVGTSQGAMLYTTDTGHTKLITVNGNNVVISSLRILGSDTAIGTMPYKPKVAEGIYSAYKNMEVNNCEIAGWGYAAIHLNKGATAFIHHNYIHHNQRIGLGYGVVLDSAKAKISDNSFSNNRLAISGSGKPGTGYEAFNNIVKQSYYGGFDMHGNNGKYMTENLKKDFVNDSTSAGDTINIHDNVFYINTLKTLQITGTPKRLIIKQNKFSAKNFNEALFKRYWAKSFVPVTEGNTYGITK